VRTQHFTGITRQSNFQAPLALALLGDLKIVEDQSARGIVGRIRTLGIDRWRIEKREHKKREDENEEYKFFH
jgi:hypothetical protein